VGSSSLHDSVHELGKWYERGRGDRSRVKWTRYGEARDGQVGLSKEAVVVVAHGRTLSNVRRSCFPLLIATAMFACTPTCKGAHERKFFSMGLYSSPVRFSPKYPPDTEVCLDEDILDKHPIHDASGPLPAVPGSPEPSFCPVATRTSSSTSIRTVEQVRSH
jgi:hypothetical protein